MLLGVGEGCSVLLLLAMLGSSMLVVPRGLQVVGVWSAERK